MRLVGILSAYDESPGWLAAAVTGFARVCDAIVYADGAYMLYPGARPCSHPAQAEAVMHAAEAAGVECLIHRPSDLYYGNEVEKRNATLRLAGALEPDWVIVFDADCHMFKCNPDVARAELEQTENLIASYTVLDGADYLSDTELADWVKREAYDTEWTLRTKDIYRWHPTLRYGPQHWMLSREIDGERQWLRHSRNDTPDCLHLNASLVAYHRSQDRTLLRRRAQAGYYKAREVHGVEPDGNGHVPEFETIA